MKTLTDISADIETKVMNRQGELDPDLKLYQVWQIPADRWIDTIVDRHLGKECLTFPDDYLLSMFVFAKDLDQVFRYANLADCEPEIFNARVIVCRHGWRSCSVGDVIVDQKGTQQYVAPIGFRLLN